MTKRTKEILDRLDEAYGREYRCYLNHDNPWQLLIAVIMSAQCTDARVNIVTKDLFRKYDTLEKFAAADVEELEQDIHSIGFIIIKPETSFSVPGNWWRNLAARCRKVWKTSLLCQEWAGKPQM